MKPLTLLFTLMTMLMAAAGPLIEQASGGWFFWLNVLFQLVWMITVVGLFLYDAEAFLTCGKDSWPVLVRFNFKI